MKINIRKATEADIESIAKVHVDSWKTSYKGILYDEIVNNVTYEKREKQWQQIFKRAAADEYTYVAESSDGKIIGFINGGPNRTGKYNCDGELYAIYLLQEYQGFGIGQRLFHAIVVEFMKHNIRSALVWVISNNPAKVFYEKLSPEQVDTKFLERLQVEETAYCWRDMHSLFHNLTQFIEKRNSLR